MYTILRSLLCLPFASKSSGLKLLSFFKQSRICTVLCIPSRFSRCGRTRLTLSLEQNRSYADARCNNIRFLAALVSSFVSHPEHPFPQKWFVRNPQVLPQRMRTSEKNFCPPFLNCTVNEMSGLLHTLAWFTISTLGPKYTPHLQ